MLAVLYAFSHPFWVRQPMEEFMGLLNQVNGFRQKHKARGWGLGDVSVPGFGWRTRASFKTFKSLQWEGNGNVFLIRPHFCDKPPLYQRRPHKFCIRFTRVPSPLLPPSYCVSHGQKWTLFSSFRSHIKTELALWLCIIRLDTFPVWL